MWITSVILFGLIPFIHSYCSSQQTREAAKVFLTETGYLKSTEPVNSSQFMKALIDFQEYQNLRLTGNLDRRTLERMGISCNRTKFEPTTSFPITTTAKPRPNQDLCRDPTFDTIFNADGGTYVFKGDKYYKLGENSVLHGYPKMISEGWPGLPSNIDGAFTNNQGKTYFFKESLVWKYIGRDLVSGYPKIISDEFKQIPGSIDTALYREEDVKVYFFKGSKFWKYELHRSTPLFFRFAHSIYNNWYDVPDFINAAFKHKDGRTYFFKGDKYYRFDDYTERVASASPAYPRPTSTWWFGCVA